MWFAAVADTIFKNRKTHCRSRYSFATDRGSFAARYCASSAVGKSLSALGFFAWRADRHNRARRGHRWGDITRGEISLDEAAERIIAAVELYHRYPTVRIVFSGGNSVFGGPPESEFAIRFLEKLDIPRDRIELESRSRNTRENAVNTMQLVRPKPGERWLLITSAYHMPRAIGLFRQAGFPVEAYPVDWQTGGWGDLSTMSFSFLGGLPHLNQAAHEWAALIFDRLSGRTAVLFPGP